MRKPATVGDYRESHLDKGRAYDAGLDQEPFDRYMASTERALLLQLVDALFPHGVPRYLDFACGTGRITAVLEQKAHEAFGVDVSETMLVEARRKCKRAHLIRADVTGESLELPPVDLITAFRFFGNAQDELRASALTAIHGLLRPGGYLLLNNHRNPWAVRNLLLRLSEATPPIEDLDYVRLRRLLTGAGFRVERTYGIGFWIVRAKFCRPAVLESRAASWLERISRIRPFGPFSPDAVIVARKVPGRA